jgi:hypothetical protein
MILPSGARSKHKPSKWQGLLQSITWNAGSQITWGHIPKGSNICVYNEFVDGEKASVKGKDADSSGDEEEKKSGSESEEDRWEQASI